MYVKLVIVIIYLLTFRESEMFVEDPMTHSEKIPVKIDIEMHKVNCKCK